MKTRPLRVMIDARVLIGPLSGVGRFVTRLVEELAAQGDVQVTALCARESYPPWRGRGDVKTVTCSFDRRDRAISRRLVWEELKLPGVVRRVSPDVFHATWNSGAPRGKKVPTVLTIHDLIPWHDGREHYPSRWHRLCHRLSIRASARRADIVTTVSNHVRTDLIRTLQLNPSRVVTVPNGVNAPDPMAPPPTPGQPYVLYVGGHERRKNVAAVFAAMDRYWAAFGRETELWLTGTSDALSPDAAAAYRNLRQKTAVRFLGVVDDAQLGPLYTGASALLLLSRSEGFGLPALEAMAHGCPVIAANASSLPEVVGNAGLLVDPADAAQTCEAIRRLLTDPALRDSLVRRGRERAGRFTWRGAARRMRDIYERAACGKIAAQRMPRALTSLNSATDQGVQCTPGPSEVGGQPA